MLHTTHVACGNGQSSLGHDQESEDILEDVTACTYGPNKFILLSSYAPWFNAADNVTTVGVGQGRIAGDKRRIKVVEIVGGKK
jgi:hypothetical protein